MRCGCKTKDHFAFNLYEDLYIYKLLNVLFLKMVSSFH